MLGRNSIKAGAIRLFVTALFLLPFLTGTVGTVAASDGNSGAVYTMTNSASDNAIQVYTRAADGTLVAGNSFSTGGLGTGTSLGSQGAVILSDDGRWLFTVNAGSNEITSFAVHQGQLKLVDTVTSGGTDPISLTADRGLLYVLNAGSGGNIAGFRVSSKGNLTPIPHSVRFLSNGGAGNAASPEEIAFSPDGRQLFVTEKGSNLIDAYEVKDGRAQGPEVIPSAGPAPYGFDFGKHNTLVVSEAAHSAVSSYRFFDSHLKVITASLVDTQAAACWLVVSKNGDFAYAANAASGTISGYSISNDGELSLLNANGITATTGSHPVDMAFGGHGQFLYNLATGNNTINAFAVDSQGGLTSIGSISSPAGATGLAAQ